ncbi:DNA-binding transcriptional regulator, LysR family [Pseudomonas cedrina]|uniref:LysR family transcriptional regulator n=2 Tax=Pseudomonas cedrina TaxID=651740 RepID=A0A1V2K1L7_PSECE|nr:LysR family transcriptional regulator [Pseudomonas cedrina]ONH51588.1 LysR family transcriptional regulator [Pseudomonas cedrina subsp. cedrina]SDT11605.1 DNA-binding transcriptional regulator, LysR family [Pseudomonas cedrina]
MITFPDLQLIATISRSKSLSDAARNLQVSPPALSMRLRRLEADLGVRLASRDARCLRLTEEGERLADEGLRLLEQLEELSDSMESSDGDLRGNIRLAAPFGFGRLRIAPLMARFAKLHPLLKLELDLRESPWTARQNCDAVIQIGPISDSSWIAQTLAANERWLCASPSYLKQQGIPRHPDDLGRHRCISIRENDELATAWYTRKGSQKVTLRISPVMVTNDGSVARRWAEQDLGLVLRSEWDVADAVASGALVRVLADWQFESAPILLLVPTRKQRARKLQALCSFLSDSMGAAGRRLRS